MEQTAVQTQTVQIAETIRTASQDQAKALVRQRLETSDRWLLRGLLAIYRYQTADEKVSRMTKHHNKVGFNGVDGEILSSFAQQVIRWDETPAEYRRYDRPLSPKQLSICRRKMVRYAGQLVRIAQNRSEADGTEA